MLKSPYDNFCEAEIVTWDAGKEAKTLPLCYAVPPQLVSSTYIEGGLLIYKPISNADPPTQI